MIVLDTHTLIWWINNPDKLSKKAKKFIEDEKSKKRSILMSSISVFEVNLLFKKGKLELVTHPDIWLETIENLTSVRFIPVDNQIAALAVNLPDISYKDPADWIIIATAIRFGLPLITADKKILNYKHVQSIW